MKKNAKPKIGEDGFQFIFKTYLFSIVIDN